MKNLRKGLREANRKNAENVNEMNKIKGQTALNAVSESDQITEDDIDFRAESKSNLNWEIFMMTFGL